MSIEAKLNGRKRILVVDDEESVRHVSRRILQKEYDVDVASDGAEAVEKLRENAYDLVISDLNMPKMNGMQLYGWMIENMPHMDGKFLISSNDIFNPLYENLIKKYSLSYVDKLTDFNDYKEKVETLIESH